MYLKKRGLADRGLIVGYDARFASEDFAQAVAEVVAAQGIKVALSSVLCPTPVVSYSIIDRKAGGGIVITASHNPWRWNGFKYKPEYGGSASPEVVGELEAAAAGAGRARGAAHGDRRGEARGPGGDVRPARAVPARSSRRLVDLDRLKSAGLNVAYDAMYGTGAGYFDASCSTAARRR